MIHRRKSGLSATIALLALAFAAPASGKKPAAADEKAVREIVQQIYANYNLPLEVSPEEASEGYQPSYSASLEALVDSWMPYGSSDYLMSMNGFDWYCQCQDYDNATAKLVSQKYDVKGKNRIEANVLFDGSGGGGEPLIFTFVRENELWLLDDLKFSEGLTLRKGLADDIIDAKKNAPLE